MLGLACKSLGWFLAGVAVALGFLLVPLQVAGERKKLDRTIQNIADAKRQIRALETEFDTRANLAQLEQWNHDKFGLTAPVAKQFVPDEVAFAQIDLNAPAVPAPDRSAVRAAAVVPQASAPVPPTTAAAPALADNARAVPSIKPQAVAMLDRKLLSDTTIGDLVSSARAEAGTLR